MTAEFQLWEKMKRIPDTEILSILDDQIRAKAHDASVRPVLPPLSRARLQAEADRGNTDAMLSLADAMRDQFGTETDAKDPRSALYWEQKAAAAGSGQGMFAVGQACEMRLYGMAQDMFQASEWYGRAARAGWPEGYWALGQLYEKGSLEGGYDPDRACHFYALGAEAGHTASMRALGELYCQTLWNPRTPPHDRPAVREKAVYWLSRAAARHDPQALVILSRAYNAADGDGLVKQDATKLFILRQHRFALQSIDWGIVFGLAWQYEKGLGCAPNLTIAARLYIFGLDAELRQQDTPEWDWVRNRAFFEENAESLGHMEHGYNGSFIGGIARLSGRSPLVQDYLENTFFRS